MIVEFSILDTAMYSLEHINDSSENAMLIKQFETNENSPGLEYYLKDIALYDETHNLSRTYLVKDKTTQELAGYFSLRTGLITRQVKDDRFDSIPAIELANFAVNSDYKKNHSDIKLLGFYIFKNFIIPLTECLGKYLGIHALYIYALPNERLIEHYGKMGFSRLPPEQEQFVQFHVKPKYDEGCIFMYQVL